VHSRCGGTLYSIKVLMLGLLLVSNLAVSEKFDSEYEVNDLLGRLDFVWFRYYVLAGEHLLTRASNIETESYLIKKGSGELKDDIGSDLLMSHHVKSDVMDLYLSESALYKMLQENGCDINDIATMIGAHVKTLEKINACMEVGCEEVDLHIMSISLRLGEYETLLSDCKNVLEALNGKP